MAERVLYQNDSEPLFPFDNVLPHLSWLPSFIASYKSPASTPLQGSLVAILDTLLVLTGTRTSSLHAIEFLPICSPLISRLNTILSSLNLLERYELEIILRGTPSNGFWIFFVTRKRSRRFNFNRSLTHVEIGKNLDMFTAGHLLTQRRDVERCTERGEMGVSMLIERSDLFSVFDEVVLLEYFTPEITERFVEWNKCKETLYNDAMMNLGLDFRFLWLFDTPSHRKQVAEQISARDPPSREWWIENFPYVLGYDAPDVIWDGTTF